LKWGFIVSEEKKVRLYMHGVKYQEDGSEAEYVEVDESQQFALFSMGWRVPEYSVGIGVGNEND